jgi:ketosteroid isomerase-like protein
MTDWTSAKPIDPAAVPPVITAYLDARKARDADAALAHFTPDARVTDEGNTYTGLSSIASWMIHAATEYTYTVELAAAAQIDSDHFDLLHHLEGDFPGGVVDLHFRFTLRDGHIAQLVIEP